MSKEETERNKAGVWLQKLDPDTYYNARLSVLLGKTRQYWGKVIRRDISKYPLPDLDRM